MKLLNFVKKPEKKREVIVDLYQRSINKIGRDQIKKMVERSMPVVSVL